MSAKESIDDESSSSNDNETITIAQIAAAHKFYDMKAKAGLQADDFILSTQAKDSWQCPLMNLYEICETRIIECPTNYTHKTLLKQLPIQTLKKKLQQKFQRRKRAINDDNATQEDKLADILVLIYYNIVFNDVFRDKAKALLEPLYLANDLLQINTAINARTTHIMFEYIGTNCIECKKDLNKSYRNGQANCRGSLGIAYHKHEQPQIAVTYTKNCKACNITYSYNRIHYGIKSRHEQKRNSTIYLDPRQLPYFSMSQKVSTLIHESIMHSIYDHQFCSKPTSIEMWVQHYNEEWKAIYQEINNMNTSTKISAELGYRTVLRNFYFYFLLCSICDIKETVININGRPVRIAAVITANDKNNIKIENQIKLDDDTDLTKHYFKYLLNKYYFTLTHCSIPELAEIPVKLNGNGDIEIYPGAFVVYGDGGQKINRSRCGYPAFLAQYDMIMNIQAQNNNQNDNNNNNNNNNINNINNINNNDNDENKLNDIGMDDNVNFTNQYNANMYSQARYYECDNSPQQAIETDDATVSVKKVKRYKTCIRHTRQLQNVHQISPEESELFIKWYQIHAAINKITHTDIEESILRYYDLDESVINSIKHKTANKLEKLKIKLAKLTEANESKILNFNKYIDQICKEIREYKQKKSVHDEPPRRKQRRAAQRAIADINEQSIIIQEQEYVEAIQEIINDDDELNVEYYNMTMDVRDLLDLEIKNNAYLEKTKGCRKAHNMDIATACKTNGLNVLMTCSGFIIRLREEIIRETPTGIILDIADACTYNSDMIEYANRIEAVGYDMMCRIYHRVIGLAFDKRLSSIQHIFWRTILDRLFVDIWHIRTHTDSLCTMNEAEGIFHPKLPKYQSILHSISENLTRVNDIIAEQFWSTMNSSKHLKAMMRETFLFFLILKTKYYNEKHKIKLQQKGWTFIPITYFITLRTISNLEATQESFPSIDTLKQGNKTPLARVGIKPDKIAEIKQMLLGDIE